MGTDVINQWCGADLTEENGWSFYSVIYFQNKSKEFSFCNECTKYIIFGEEFKEKFEQITKGMPAPPLRTDEKAREEFKSVVKHLLFLASYEPVITPSKITDEVEKMVDRAGQVDN